MEQANEYKNILDFIEQKRNELQLLSTKHSIFLFFKKKKIKDFINKYDDMYYKSLLKFENMIEDEYEFNNNLIKRKA